MEELKAQEAEALDILEAMNPTIDDAIKYYKNMIFPQDMSAHTLRAVAMNKLVIKALQEKAARDKPENKPLTLEQLKQMEGEQVWIPETEAYFSGHGIVNVKEEKVYASDEENDYYPFDEYGAWLAYARKPEGG